MSDTAASLRRKIVGAGDLESVVRTMKARAASSIGQYENAVRALDDYYWTVQLGLAASFRQGTSAIASTRVSQKEVVTIGAVVFGSDQGLVGQFNDAMADFVVQTLDTLPGKKTVWAVGERIQSRFADTGLLAKEGFGLPNSISAITPLVSQILIEMESQRKKGAVKQVYLFHNRPKSGAIYTPVVQRLLPLDELWRHDLEAIRWPTNNLPEVMNGGEQTLLALVREYLFVSIFRACAESLASENASRLAAMQRAEKNIDELLEDLNRTFHRLRQSDIDEELFDVVSGFEALVGARKRPQESTGAQQQGNRYNLDLVRHVRDE
jgi:F-type H+-transporting ATPase subunit gamma